MTKQSVRNLTVDELEHVAGGGVGQYPVPFIQDSPIGPNGGGQGTHSPLQTPGGRH